MVIVCTVYDGRTIAKSTQTIAVLAGDIGLSITFPELDNVETVLEVEVMVTVPPVETPGAFSHKNIQGNVVGITLWDISAGCTLTWEMVAIGH